MDGYTPANVDYPASIALFTSGKAAMHINGVWEVPTMTDLAKEGKLGFEWGAIRMPVLFNQPGHLGRLAIPSPSRTTRARKSARRS